MKRLSMIGIILLSMVNIAGFAQNIRYYSLQKITQLNKVDTKCSGGQFVNIKEYVCFDSDKDGKSVGNGKLYIDKKNTDVSQIVYVGSSYHGNSRYIFSKDFSILKVEINPHYIYEYRLSTPPKSALTCSLIKKDNSSKAPSYSNPVFIQGNNDWDFGESLNNLDGTENISVNGNCNSSPQNQTRFKCAKHLPTYNPQMRTVERNDIGRERLNSGKAEQYNEFRNDDWKWVETGKRYPSDVLEYDFPEELEDVVKFSNWNGALFGNTDKTVKHPTSKPVPMLEYLIKTYTNEGDKVLDNCMGSGSTGVACVNINRNFIGIEIRDFYFKMAQKRIENAVELN